MALGWRSFTGPSAYKISERTFYTKRVQNSPWFSIGPELQHGGAVESAQMYLGFWLYLLMCHRNLWKPSPTDSAEQMSPSWFCTPLDVPAAFTPSFCSPAGVQASASTWLLNLSLSCVLRPTSEGKLNIPGAVCWCLYLIKCTDEVLIYCRAVFTLYYKEITQLEWDQAGNTVRRFHNLIAKRKQEPGGGWRRVGWWVGGWVIIVEGWADTNTTTYKRRDVLLTLLPPC